MSSEFPLHICLSGRTLFNFKEEHDAFKSGGMDKYQRVQNENIHRIAEPGVAFSLIKKLLDLNSSEKLVSVSVFSRNNPKTGFRLYNSILHYGLNVDSISLTDGKPVADFINSYHKIKKVDLVLSANIDSIMSALNNNIPAAHMLDSAGTRCNEDKIKIAFDGDCVLFNNESEQIYQKHGIEAFKDNEINNRDVPLKSGPFYSFLKLLSKLKGHSEEISKKIEISLVTVRGKESYERVNNTFREWGVLVDNYHFMDGKSKEGVLKKLAPDIFFDDQIKHIHGINIGGFVPNSATQQRNKEFAAQGRAD